MPTGSAQLGGMKLFVVAIITIARCRLSVQAVVSFSPHKARHHHRQEHRHIYVRHEIDSGELLRHEDVDKIGGLVARDRPQPRGQAETVAGAMRIESSDTEVALNTTGAKLLGLVLEDIPVSLEVVAICGVTILDAGLNDIAVKARVSVDSPGFAEKKLSQLDGNGWKKKDGPEPACKLWNLSQMTTNRLLLLDFEYERPQYAVAFHVVTAGDRFIGGLLRLVGRATTNDPWRDALSTAIGRGGTINLNPRTLSSFRPAGGNAVCFFCMYEQAFEIPNTDENIKIKSLVSYAPTEENSGPRGPPGLPGPSGAIIDPGPPESNDWDWSIHDRSIQALFYIWVTTAMNLAITGYLYTSFLNKIAKAADMNFSKGLTALDKTQGAPVG